MKLLKEMALPKSKAPVRKQAAGADKKVYYFEHYPHYAAGTMNSKFVTTVGLIDQLAAAMDAAKNAKYKQKYTKKHTRIEPKTNAEKAARAEYERLWQIVDDFEKKLGDQYAFFELLEKWPKIRKVVVRGGTWGDMWEEGSHALSGKSAKDAFKKVRQIEAKVKYDEMGEDW